ncbi:hypothetical protein ACHAWF_011996 [Thalassiosira exigua]
MPTAYYTKATTPDPADDIGRGEADASHQSEKKPGRRGGLYYAVRVGYAFRRPAAAGDDVVIRDGSNGKKEPGRPQKKRKRGDGSSSDVEDESFERKPVAEIRSAIFLYWEDAQKFVGGNDSRAEYAAFTSFEEAEKYLMDEGKRVAPGGAETIVANNFHEEAKGREGRTENPVVTMQGGIPGAVFNAHPPLAMWNPFYGMYVGRGNHGSMHAMPGAVPMLPPWNQTFANPMLRAGGPRIANVERPTHSGPTLVHTMARSDGKNTRNDSSGKKPAPPVAMKPMGPKQEELWALSHRALLFLARITKEKMYQDMVEYKRMTGSIYIPENNLDGQPKSRVRKLDKLRKWSIAQIEHQLRLSRGIEGAGILTPERIGRLRSLGFRLASSWDELYDRLASHEADTGSLTVKREDDAELFAWAKEQWKMVELHSEAKHVALSSARIERLISLKDGQKVEAKSDRNKRGAKSGSRQEGVAKWDDMYQKLVKYKEANGTASILDALDKDEVDSNTKALKSLRKWCNKQILHQRRRSQGHQDTGDLTDERVGKLRDVGLPLAPPWSEFYDRLASFKAANGTLDVAEEEDEELFEWAREQKLMLARNFVGRPVALSEDQIRDLLALGYEIKRTGGNSARVYDAASEEVKWNAMFEAAVDYKEGKGTFDFPEEHSMSQSEKDLAKWVKRTTQEVKKYQCGKRSIVTEAQLERLKEIGLVPDAVSKEDKWNSMYDAAAEYREEKGSFDFPEEQSKSEAEKNLAKWVKKTKLDVKKYQLGKKSILTEAHLERLKEIGLVLDVSANEEKWTKKELKWDQLLEAAVRYREERGTFELHHDTKSMPKEERMIKYWICEQRREYRKLQEGKETTLTAQRLQRLNDIGLDLAPRKAILPWSERVERLRLFVEEHGHCKPPKKSVLGKFVTNTRRRYRERQEGKKNALTDERIRDMEELGFVWQAGKTPNVVEIVRRSWEERFQDLLEFKAEHGHTVVPQLSGRLGAWVHEQRSAYRQMKLGQRTHLTPERALMLTEIGFCFDAKSKRGGRREPETNEPLENSDFY